MPPLVVASALKPRYCSTLAAPASQGFGITNGSPSCRARKVSARSACDIGRAYREGPGGRPQGLDEDRRLRLGDVRHVFASSPGAEYPLNFPAG